MRISSNQQDFLSTYWHNIDNSCLVYLFGSRTDDTKKGGDIDILLLTDKKLHHSQIFKMKQSFYSLFGEQKIDIVNFEKNDENAFKNYILSYAIIL